MATPTHELGLAERLDPTIRPQDDFYTYTNGKWLAAHPIPDSETRWGAFNILRDQALEQVRTICEELQDSKPAPGSLEQQIRDFYLSGIHFDQHKSDNLQVLQGYFAQIDAVQSTSQLSALIGCLHRMGVAAPWRVIIDADDMDSKRHIVRLAQTRLTLPDRDYYLDDSAKMQQIRSDYRQHTQAMLTHFPNLADNAEQLWQAIWDFEHSLAQKARSRSDLRDVYKNYNNTPFSELSQKYTGIDWNAYAEALGWINTDNLSVDQPEFFEYVSTLMTSQSLDTWKIYLKWLVLVEYGGKLSEELSQLRFEFFGRILGGTTQILPLWKRVVAALDTAMGEGVGRLWATQHFPEESKKQVLDLVEDIRRVYSQRIQSLDWMTEPTKKTAQEKLANIKVLIGYPDHWRDFSGLHITPQSYLANAIAAEEFSTDYWLDKLNQPTSRDDWFMNPQTVNAYHDPNRLVICFPGAILQPPFFDPQASYAANIGAIGAVIGHEFTHGFDDQGCEFDQYGNVRAWQTADERKQFHQRAQLIIQQANQFETLPGVHLKGDLIIGEAIADLGGVELAHHALLAHTPNPAQPDTDGLSTDQVFFISFASTECGVTRNERRRQLALSDPHPIEEFRVNCTLSHCDSFYAVFDVKEGDKSYRPPAERAKIW